MIPSLRPAGAERQLGYLCQGIVPLGWDVHVATFEAEGPVRTRIEASGASLHVVARSHAYDPRAVSRLVRLVRRLRPTFVQTWLTAADILGGSAALLTRTPWILSDRTTFFEVKAPPVFHVLLRMVPYARAIVSNSNGGAAFWERRLRSPPPRFVVRNALPLDEIAAAPTARRASLGIPEGVPLIIKVGRLAEPKNVMTVLAALRRVLQETPAVALLAGDGPLAAQVRRFITAHDLAGRVFTPGYLEHAWSWLKAADAFVSASHREGMPNAVMEAMAIGCPMVLSDMISHREIVPPDGALFVPTKDAEAFAVALRDTLTDRTAAQARAAVALKAASVWSIASVARHYAEIYEQLR